MHFCPLAYCGEIWMIQTVPEKNRPSWRQIFTTSKYPQQADEEDGYETLDEDIRQREVKTISHRVVDALRIYVGDRKFDTRLRFWVDIGEDPMRSHILEARSPFCPWTHSRSIHDMSTFYIALLLLLRSGLNNELGSGLEESTGTECGEPVDTRLHSGQVQAILRTKQSQSRSW